MSWGKLSVKKINKFFSFTYTCTELCLIRTVNPESEKYSSKVRIDHILATVKEHRDSNGSAANLDGDLNNINDAGAVRSATV